MTTPSLRDEMVIYYRGGGGGWRGKVVGEFSREIGVV